MQRQKSVMTHQFSQVPKAEIQRSTFDRSHGLKTTFDAGYLYPILCDEALPGDSFNVKMTGFSRLATPIFPIMDNMRMETFFFAVPNRLLWDNWQKFNGEQTNPGDSTEYTIPTISSTPGFAEGSLTDYMGFPTKVPNITGSSLWHRAYNLIYNEWFRDQNLQDPAFIDTSDNPATDDVNYTLRRRGKRHDYFTSCLPWPQKGDPVSIPLGGQAPVVGDVTTNTNAPLFTGIATGSEVSLTSIGGDQNATYSAVTQVNGTAKFGSETGLQLANAYADLSAASSITINSLREAFQIQRLLERDARGGSRYIEIIKSHFGVTSPDSRLQRPEYLGGGSSSVNISPIAQTTPTSISPESPQGNLAAVGTTSLHNHGFNKSFTEHCTIIGLVSVRADLTYQQGLPRQFSRQTRYDFYWPALAHLGEQAVLNKELYAQGTSDDELVFGYQERYAEYRYKPSQLTGKMRSNATGSLDAWHLSQDFAGPPLLSDGFIQETPPVSRVVAVTTEPQFIFDGYFKMRCARPMPLYGVPGLIDHF